MRQRLVLKASVVAGRMTLMAVAGLIIGASAFADAAPDCMGWNNQPLAINNNEIVHWKRTTPNQFRDRGHAEGQVIQVYPDRNGHKHFEIQIGSTPDDTLEVIYNQDFGTVATPNVGDSVEACGDYITSTADSGPYPASPDGAILHWVHQSPNLAKHPSGFLMINGLLYGQDAEHAGPNPHPHPRPYQN